MGSCVVMHFSGASELHDGIGRTDSVGNFLQCRQILLLSPACAADPARAPAACTVRRGARPGSSAWGTGDWVVSSGSARLLLLRKSHPSRRIGTAGTRLFCLFPLSG